VGASLPSGGYFTFVYLFSIFFLFCFRCYLSSPQQTPGMFEFPEPPTSGVFFSAEKMVSERDMLEV